MRQVSPLDHIVRIKAIYPYHVIREVAGQPDPQELSHRFFGHFGRVPHEPSKSNLWCFGSEEARRKFINMYGGDIPQ